MCKSLNKYPQYLEYKIHLKASAKALTGAKDSADDLLEDEVDQRVWASGPKANRAALSNTTRLHGQSPACLWANSTPALVPVADKSPINYRALLEGKPASLLPLLQMY